MSDRRQALEMFKCEIGKYSTELHCHYNEILDPAWHTGAINGFQHIIEEMGILNDKEMVPMLEQLDIESRKTKDGIWTASNRGINYAAGMALTWFREINKSIMPNAVLATINNGCLHLKGIRV